MAKIFGVLSAQVGSNNQTAGIKKAFIDKGYFRLVEKQLPGITLGGFFLNNESGGVYQDKNGNVCLFAGYLLEAETKAPIRFVLENYLRTGLGFFNKLNGIFNIIIYDAKKKTFFVFNDRYGVLPIYYYVDNHRLILASEVKSLIDTGLVKKRINWAAWGDYFAFRYLLGNKTLFENIESLPAGSILSYRSGRTALNSYWDYTNVLVNKKSDLMSAIGKGGELIRQAVVRSAAGVTDPICFLSGGYDSRCLASVLKYQAGVDFPTYTTEHPAGQKDYQIAGQVAKALGIKNKLIRHPSDLSERYYLKKAFLTDGMAVEHIWALPLSDFLTQSATMFDGLAGDLLLKGLFLDPVNLENADNKDKLVSVLFDQCGYSVWWVKHFFNKETAQKISRGRDSLASEIRKIPQHDNIVSIFFAKNRTRNALSLMSNNIFPQMAKRFPFLDNDLVDFALSLPPQLKTQDHLYLKILEANYPKIMKLPTTNDTNLSVKIDALAWQTLTRLRLQRLVKTTGKQYLYQRMVGGNDIAYFKRLINDLVIPEYLNRSKLLKKYGDGDRFDFSFFQILEHVVWYNLFFLGKADEMV